jgi:hypothetical protein
VRSKAISALILAAALAPAAAFAAPPPGKGKPSATGTGCKPRVTVVVRGTAAADGGTTLSLTVSGGNHWAKLLFANNTTTTTTVTTSQTTRVTVAEKAGSLSSIKKGDRVLVQYRVCKGDLSGQNTANASALAGFLGSTAPKRVVDLGTETESDND